MDSDLSEELQRELTDLAVKEGIVLDSKAVQRLAKLSPAIARLAIGLLAREAVGTDRIQNASSYLMGIIKKLERPSSGS